MADTIDPARAADLLTSKKGCRVLDAAVAMATGYKADFADGIPYYWAPTGKRIGHYAPRFTTAGDGDPYARWDLVAAMWKALEAVAVAITIERETGNEPNAGSSHPAPFVVTFWFNDVTSESCDAPTPHRALVLALAAAGLLEENDHE